MCFYLREALLAATTAAVATANALPGSPRGFSSNPTLRRTDSPSNHSRLKPTYNDLRKRELVHESNILPIQGRDTYLAKKPTGPARDGNSKLDPHYLSLKLVELLALRK